jgi:hypothetical protein
MRWTQVFLKCGLSASLSNFRILYFSHYAIPLIRRVSIDVQTANASSPLVTVVHDDLVGVLGEIDDAKTIEILALQPTLAELEEAAFGQLATVTSSPRVVMRLAGLLRPSSRS